MERLSWSEFVSKIPPDKVDDISENTNIDSSTLAKFKLFVKQHPELLDELLE